MPEDSSNLVELWINDEGHSERHIRRHDCHEQQDNSRHMKDPPG